MRILVAGAGVVGFNLARQLVAEGQDVSLLDDDPEAVRHATERLDVLAVRGHAANLADLQRAGLEQTQLLVAVTRDDETNMIACFLAGEHGVRRRVARVRNLQYAGLPAPINLAPLHIDRIVNPDEVLVEGVLRVVGTPGAFEAADFAEGQILLRGFEVPPDSTIAGRRLTELRGLGLEGILIVGIIRERRLRVPTGDDEIQAGDHVFILSAKDALSKLLKLVVPNARPVRRVIITGGGPAGIHLAQRLSDTVDEVVMLEADAERAEAAAAELRKATVLRGEPTDGDVLRDADAKNADVFVAVGPRDDENLLSALLAKRQGASRTVVMSSDPAYVPILNSIGIDAAVNPRLMTVGEILRELRRGRIHSVAKLQEFEAEALEIEVMTGSPAAGKELRSIKFPRGALVGAVLKDGTPMIPRGDTVLEPGMIVIIFTLPSALEKIEKLFLRKRTRTTRVLAAP
ncbi:MAG: Trk system potassium transporter TrkA [Planctomycetota bacterium]|jgi:trk system potassium uptake protein TrkA